MDWKTTNMWFKAYELEQKYGSFDTPASKRRNVFSAKDWQNYDYQKDIRNDKLLQAVKPVGREVI